MDTLIVVILSGMGVAYITELIATIGEGLFSARIIRLVLTLPLAILACWFLDLTGFELAVGSSAAAFFSLALLRLINKPAIVQTLRR